MTADFLHLDVFANATTSLESFVLRDNFCAAFNDQHLDNLSRLLSKHRKTLKAITIEGGASCKDFLTETHAALSARAETAGFLSPLVTLDKIELLLAPLSSFCNLSTHFLSAGRENAPPAEFSQRAPEFCAAFERLTVGQSLLKRLKTLLADGESQYKPRRIIVVDCILVSLLPLLPEADGACISVANKLFKELSRAYTRHPLGDRARFWKEQELPEPADAYDAAKDDFPWNNWACIVEPWV